MVEFKQDSMKAILDKIDEQKGTVVFISDHGSKLVTRTKRLEGDWDPLHHGEKMIFPQRFALGTFHEGSGWDQEIVRIDTPSDYRLPGGEAQRQLVLATSDFRFKSRSGLKIHEYAHGGISMEELLVPLIVFEKE
jgi:hypothetical protein